LHEKSKRRKEISREGKEREMVVMGGLTSKSYSFEARPWELRKERGIGPFEGKEILFKVKILSLFCFLANWATLSLFILTVDLEVEFGFFVLDSFSMVILFFFFFFFFFFFLRFLFFFLFFHFVCFLFIFFFVLFVQTSTESLIFNFGGFSVRKLSWVEEELSNLYDLKVQKFVQESMRIFFVSSEVKNNILLHSTTPEILYSRMEESWNDFSIRLQKEEEDRRNAIHFSSSQWTNKKFYFLVGGLLVLSFGLLFFFFDGKDVSISNSSELVSSSPLFSNVSELDLPPFGPGICLIPVAEIQEPITVALSSGMGLPSITLQEQEAVDFFRRLNEAS